MTSSKSEKSGKLILTELPLEATFISIVITMPMVVFAWVSGSTPASTDIAASTPALFSVPALTVYVAVTPSRSSPAESAGTPLTASTWPTTLPS